MSVVDSIGAILTAQGAVGGDSGYTLALNWMPPSPDQIVAVTEYGGDVPQHRAGLERHSVQVRVRGLPSGAQAAATKMDAVRTILAYHDRTDDSTDVLECVPRASGMLSMGRDDNERPEFSVNFEVWRSRA